MKNLESNSEKNTGATSKTAATAALRMLVSVTIVSLFSLSNILIPDTAPQLVVAEEAQQNVNSMEEINFSSPFSNSFSLGTPFLVEYDNTTSLKAKKNAGPQSFDLTFEGYGTVNGLRYKDNGTGIFLTNPVDGSVYQKGVIELKTDSDAIETTYESISRKHDNGIVLDNGIMIFNASSSKGGELSFLNNTVAAYKDIIDLRRGNLTTIAWEWK
ncbi:MAG: hypothetical protein WAM88_03475 [Nitrososphaeraceae archaeon]